MARKLDAFPATNRGRAEQYPWSEWLDGSAWQLDAGEDFDAKISLASFRAGAQAAAKKRDGKVRTSVINGGKSIVIQFFKP